MEMRDEIKELVSACENLAKVYGVASSRKRILTHQGQAMDGFTELAEYRNIIKTMILPAVNTMLQGKQPIG